MLFLRLLSSHLLSAATNLCEGQRVTWALWKQYSPFNGGSEIDILFPFYDEYLYLLWYFLIWEMVVSLLVLTLYLWKPVVWPASSSWTTTEVALFTHSGVYNCVTTEWCKRRAVLDSAGYGFFTKICSAWCNNESVMCSPLPESWQLPCSVLPFHRWAPLQQRLCLFYMNPPLTLVTTNHFEWEVRG